LADASEPKRQVSRATEPERTVANLVPNAGLVLAGTVMVRLGLEALINRWVHTGSALPGRKVLTVVSAMLAGATHIDHVDVLRAGATSEVLPHRVMAPSTIGTFLRTFTFGHVRQLDAVLSRALAGAWALGAGPTPGEAVVVDLDSTICVRHEVARLRAGSRNGGPTDAMMSVV
jgi:hypothetical protein